MRMNLVPQPQEETLGYYLQSGACLVALETNGLINFLWSVACNRPVINVTLLTLKIVTQNKRLIEYFPNVLMKLFQLYMFELDINTNWRHLWCVFLLTKVTYVTFFYEIAYNDFIDCILKLTMFPNLKYVIRIYIQMMNFHFHTMKLFITCNWR